MQIFNFISGLCSIISLILGVFSLVMIKETKDKINTFTNSKDNKIATDNYGQIVQAENTTGIINVSGGVGHKKDD